MLTVYLKDPKERAQACVIWMHGLGADAADMSGLAAQLPIQDVALRHVFIDAPTRAVTINGGMSMRAWYDITGMDITSREDSEGITASHQEILAVVNQQLEAGFKPAQIYLAGFSQGGAMAFYTGLHLPQLGGIISLSAYIPIITSCKPILAKNTPLFIANGHYDPIVWPAWTQASIRWLASQGFNEIEHHEYPMEHAICAEEIQALSRWLTRQVKEC